MKLVTITITALVTDKAWENTIEGKCESNDRNAVGGVNAQTKAEFYTYDKTDETPLDIVAELNEDYAEIISSRIEITDAQIGAK